MKTYNKSAPKMSERDQALAELTSTLMDDVPKYLKQELQPSVKALVVAYDARDQAHAQLVGGEVDKPSAYLDPIVRRIHEAVIVPKGAKEIMDFTISGVDEHTETLKAQALAAQEPEVPEGLAR
jgi:hypothetical protein